MMFRGEREVEPNHTSIFKWRKHGSSLTSPLLNITPPEIELSDYRRAPSPGSESPSRFLNDERSNIEPIADLDLFFERIYNYYCEKGLWCIIIKWIIELLSLIFIICFSAFFLLYVDWYGLRYAKCGMEAVESGTKPCDLSKEALHEYPLTPFTISKAIIVGYLGIFSIYLLFCFLRFFAQLKATLTVRKFYYDSLNVTDKEIQTMSWELILEKVVQLQNTQQLCVVKDLSIHDIVMRLMRKENYLIGMLNKGVLAFPIFWWVPGAGPIITCGPNKARQRLILPKTLEWTLNWCILQSMFDRNFCLRREFLSDPEALRKRLMIVGFVMLLLSPFLIIFMIVYLFLKYAEQFYNQPSTASSRRWSNLAKWMFREFNEVDHLFKHRMNSSLIHSSNYIKQFPSPILSVIAKFISFVSGGLAAVLIIVAFLDESLLEGHIFGRNLLWYTAVFGTITAISRAAVSDELLVLDPQGMMSLVVQHTHYMPKKWRGKENSDTVRVEFETLFKYTGMMLLEEMASIFLTPYLLLFVVPKRVDDILQFIADFTIEVEGVGHVCSFSIFDFQNHGNSKYGSPFDTPRIQRSSQGKMEKSFLSFQSSYPLWEPNVEGKQFLATLKTFGEHISGPGTGPTNMPSRSPNSGVGEKRCTFCMRNNQLNLMGNNNDQLNNYPYILDCYYTSQPQHDSLLPDPGRSRLHDPDRSLAHHDPDQSKEFWTRSSVRENDENWGYVSENRSEGGDLIASTSAPLFHESILQHQEEDDINTVINPRKSNWWDRNNRQGKIEHTSFLEPPNFVREPYKSEDHLETLTPSQHTVVQVNEPTNWWGPRESTLSAPTQAQAQATSFLQPPDFIRSNVSSNYHDNISETSLEEEEEDDRLDWRNSSNRLSRTFYMDDVENGEMNLPFDDIYQKDSENFKDSSSSFSNNWPEDPSNLV